MFLILFHPWENQALNSVTLRSVPHDRQAALERKSLIFCQAGLMLMQADAFLLGAKSSPSFNLGSFLVSAWFFFPQSLLHLSSQTLSFSFSPPKLFLNFPFSLSADFLPSQEMVDGVAFSYLFTWHVLDHLLHAKDRQENQPWSTIAPGTQTEK